VGEGEIGDDDGLVATSGDGLVVEVADVGGCLVVGDPDRGKAAPGPR
jgi:hypothetical protein